MTDPFKYTVPGEVLPESTNQDSADLVSGVKVEFLKTANPCCLHELTSNPISVPGQEIHCTCGNRMVAVNATFESPVIKSRHPITGFDTVRPAQDYRYSIIAYDQTSWLPNMAMKDVEDRGEVPAGVSRVSTSEVVYLRPHDWFEKGSFHAVHLDTGVVAVIGKILPEYSDEDTSADDMDDSSFLLGVETI